MSTRTSLWLTFLAMAPLFAACDPAEPETVKPDPVDTEPLEEDTEDDTIEEEVEPACDDGVRNGSETDIDCGGSCGPCDVGEGCVTGADCVDGVCDGGACQEAACDDGVLNGVETDIDCGGGDCGACDAGDTCDTAEDCLEGVCEDGTCQEATCDDDVLNGQETDLDCGGSDCGPCDRYDACETSDDCRDSVCVDQICERAMFITGTTVETGSIIGVYTSQSIVRVDFESPPTVTDFDGSPLSLPISDGSFVSSGISPSLDSATVTVAGVELTSPTGYSYYQSIAPDYYGVILSLSDPSSATASYNALNVEGLDNEKVEIMILDTTP